MRGLYYAWYKRYIKEKKVKRIILIICLSSFLLSACKNEEVLPDETTTQIQSGEEENYAEGILPNMLMYNDIVYDVILGEHIEGWQYDTYIKNNDLEYLIMLGELKGCGINTIPQAELEANFIPANDTVEAYIGILNEEYVLIFQYSDGSCLFSSSELIEDVLQ